MPAAEPELVDLRAKPDPAVRLLQAGLIVVLIAAPMLFGAVNPAGRAALEIASFALLAIWLVRALAGRMHPAELPPPIVGIAIAGLLAWGAVQTLPVGRAVVRALSPHAVELREDARGDRDALQIETRLLGTTPASLDRPASLSLDPRATASALRTGAALAALLLVSIAVAARCGRRGVALGLVASTGFQALYGLLTVAAGHERIWHVPKVHFLDSATGTYVNRNHFACLVVMGLAVGLGLWLDTLRRSSAELRATHRAARWLGADGGSLLVLALVLLVGMSGLLLSHSRAGIVLGGVAVAVTLVGDGRPGRWRTRLAVALIVAAAASIPLVQLGPGMLFERYSSVLDELEGARAVMWGDTARMIAAFPVTGSGYGSFAAVYPAFRSPEIRKFFAHAHNDPLQAIAEGGLVAGVLWLMLLAPLARRMFRAMAGRDGALGAGIAAAMAAFAVHGLVDFNGHIPANAAVAAILAGVTLGARWKTAA